MTRNDLLVFMRSHRYAVQSSVSQSGSPQSAVVGIAVGDDLSLVFDTLDSTRKAQNLRRNPNIALVIGGLKPGDERTVQYEGIADEPHGEELERTQHLYFASFPDGPERQHWQGITYIRVRPTWIRYSDYNKNPPEIVEFDLERIRHLQHEHPDDVSAKETSSSTES